MIIRNAEININPQNIYKCYSPLLCRFLEENKGIQHIFSGENNKNNKQYWLFIKTDELQQALKEWSENKSSGNLFFKREGGKDER